MIGMASAPRSSSIEVRRHAPHAVERVAVVRAELGLSQGQGIRVPLQGVRVAAERAEVIAQAVHRVERYRVLGAGLDPLERERLLVELHGLLDIVPGRRAPWPR